MNRTWYTAFRMIFGGYLYVHFLSLLPWSVELFAEPDCGGMLTSTLSPLIRAFPNVLGVVDSSAFVFGFTALAAALSLLFAAGYKDRWAAVGIWFIWACLLGRNPLILNPGLPYVGWLLLMHAAMPTPRGDDWKMSNSFLGTAWMVMVVGYTFSGLTKLGSPSWMDGSALLHVLEGPLARPTVLREWLVSHPDMLRLASWGTLGLEILAAPLAISKRTRPMLWFALTGLQVGILFTVDFTDLTLGMLMIHLLTFDPSWLDFSRATSRVLPSKTADRSRPS